MEDKERVAFEQILKVMGEKRELYDSYPRCRSRDGERFTVLGLADLAGNHLFDDYPELFGITKHQGHVIRAYFENNDDKVLINELYENFRGVFEGESKRYVGGIEGLSEEVVLF
ncbi:hypothetical protein HNV12_02945 [Methanococcoides sp. SA1]|nr:hypothetical protein [Methanococcoides sp. SA1]